MLFPKPKKKRKSRHISNERITEYAECEHCGRMNASENHELFHAASRSKSIKYGAQMVLCQPCHQAMHSHPNIELPYKRVHQFRIMQEQEWDRERWLQEFGRNWL